MSMKWKKFAKRSKKKRVFMHTNIHFSYANIKFSKRGIYAYELFP